MYYEANLKRIAVGYWRRQDERLANLEMQQTLANQAWQRQGKVVEEINQRCLGKLGLKCPLVEAEDQNGD